MHVRFLSVIIPLCEIVVGGKAHAILDVHLSLGGPMPLFSPSPFSLWLRLLLGVLGAASFGAGVAAVFLSTNGTGTGVLVAFGGIVLVLALLGDRIESLEFGGTKLKMRAAAAEKFALAEDSENRGDRVTAARLRAEAQALLEAAGPIAAEYRTVRGSMPPGPGRTMAMERVVARARKLADEQTFDPAEVLRWLREGNDEERVTALAMMQAKPELRNFDSALTAIKGSRTPFEQYHALLLADMMLDDLDAGDKQRLVQLVQSVRSRRFRRDTDRWLLSERILRRASERPD
jgi:hypothetical protein